MMDVRLLSACFTGWLFASQVAFGQEPGLIVVIGEIPERMEFRVPEDSPYKFQYNPARITLWDSIEMQNPIPSGTVFQAGAAVPGCEVDLSDFASFQACFSGDGSGVAPGCDGFDEDADNDVDLDDYAVFHGTFIGPVCNVVFVPVFVEGLTASADLGDVVITLLTDPDGDDEFTVEATQPVTVVSIDIAPTSGPVETAITITLQPAVAPLAFDPLTTAEWSGVFQPIAGPTSDPFTITYSSSQFRESSPSTATILLGEGDGLPPIPPQGTPPGTLNGTLSLGLSDHTLRRSLNFQIAALLIDWFRIHYPADEFGYLAEPPSLSAEPLEKIPIYEVPSTGAVPEFLNTAYFYHTACVLLLDENAITVAEAPPTFVVDLVSLAPNDVEIDRVSGVTLTQASNDGDPDHMIYHSDLARPIVVVEGAIDEEQFPGQIILLGSEDGTVAVVEAGP